MEAVTRLTRGPYGHRDPARWKTNRNSNRKRRWHTRVTGSEEVTTRVSHSARRYPIRWSGPSSETDGDPWLLRIPHRNCP